MTNKVQAEEKRTQLRKAALEYHCVLRPLQGVDVLLVGHLPVLVPA